MKTLKTFLVLSLLIMPAFAMAGPPPKKVVIIEQKHDQGKHLGHYKNKKKVVIVKEQCKPASSIQVKINL